MALVTAITIHRCSSYKNVHLMNGFDNDYKTGSSVVRLDIPVHSHLYIVKHEGPGI